MACFWKNERNAVEVCDTPWVHGLGNFLYWSFDATMNPDDSSLVELKADLSGVIWHNTPGYIVPAAAGMVTFNRHLLIWDDFDDEGTWFWHIGGGQELAIPGTLGVDFPAYEQSNGYAGAAFRGSPLSELFFNQWVSGTAWDIWYTTDGVTWGELAAPFDVGYDPQAVFRIGPRLLAATSRASPATTRMYYSDNNGSSWIFAAALTAQPANAAFFKMGDGSVLVAYFGAYRVYAARTTDGASWGAGSVSVGAGNSSYGTSVYGPMCSTNGNERAVLVYKQDDPFVSMPGTTVVCAYTDDYGATWIQVQLSASGLPGSGWGSAALFWTGVQFALVMTKDATQESRVYTSANGAVWSPDLVVPHYSLFARASAVVA